MKITDTQLRNAKPKQKEYKLTDGHGLHVLVKTNGSKLWRWRYELGGKEKQMSFGSYPQVTISAARARARGRPEAAGRRDRSDGEEERNGQGGNSGGTGESICGPASVSRSGKRLVRVVEDWQG